MKTYLLLSKFPVGMCPRRLGGLFPCGIVQEAVLDGVSDWGLSDTDRVPPSVTTLNAMRLAGGAALTHQHILECITRKKFRGKPAEAQAALRDELVPAKKRAKRKMQYVPAQTITTFAATPGVFGTHCCCPARRP